MRSTMNRFYPPSTMERLEGVTMEVTQETIAHSGTVQIQARSTVDNNGGKFDIFIGGITLSLLFYRVFVAIVPPDGGLERMCVHPSATPLAKERKSVSSIG